MNQIVFIALMGSIGAIIGWVTNVLAIKFLFRPYKSFKVPLLGVTLQGLIPKRQKDIAIALGNIVSTDLLTAADVAQSITRDDMKEKIALKIEKHVQERVLVRIPFVLPTSLQLMLTEYAGKTIHQEVMGFLQDPQKILNDEELENIKLEIKKIVEEKVISFDMKQLEELTFSLAKTEFKHIEVLGGLLGFLIGIIQGIIVHYFG